MKTQRDLPSAAKLQSERLTRSLKCIGVGGFETAQDCHERQTKMLRRLCSTDTDKSLIRSLERCDYRGCDEPVCCEACHWGQWRQRWSVIKEGSAEILRQRRTVFAVSIVHPNWSVDEDRLDRIPMAAAQQWVRRRLRNLGCENLAAVGSFEASLNVACDGSKRWAGHVHLAVVGPTKPELKAALKIVGKKVVKSSKPVVVEEAYHVGGWISYATKRIGEKRKAYIDPGNGRQNQRELRFDPQDHQQFDRWLSGMKLGRRLIIIGFDVHGRMRLRPKAG